MTSDKVYQSWAVGIVEGIFLESGIFNSEPLLNFVKGLYKDFGSFKRKIAVSAVDVNTGSYVTFTDKDTSFWDYPLRVVSSASIPFIFPHRHVGNYILMDGGTVWNTNLVSAIDRCMEVVDDHS